MDYERPILHLRMERAAAFGNGFGRTSFTNTGSLNGYRDILDLYSRVYS